jgi:hypothetical protein
MEITTIAEVASDGGKARAESLSPEKRSEIAKKAADARWDIPKASHSGEMRIGDIVIPCAVLDDATDGKTNTRVLTQRGFSVALGRYKNPKKGAIGELPVFLGASNLKPFITDDLARSATQIRFRLAEGSGGLWGNIALGYSADLLPAVCRVFLDADAEGKLRANQKHIAARARMLLSGFATVGIIALVDEATGFQEIRDRAALQEILDKYLRKDFAKWAKRFSDNFYREIFRLRGWQWKGMKVNRPQCVANYTRDLVYARLAPNILAELETRNPPDEHGKRKHKHHQLFTDDIGHPALAQHLDNLEKIMKGYDDWNEMIRHVNKALPKQWTMPLYEDDNGQPLSSSATVPSQPS